MSFSWISNSEINNYIVMLNWQLSFLYERKIFSQNYFNTRFFCRLRLGFNILVLNLLFIRKKLFWANNAQSDPKNVLRCKTSPRHMTRYQESICSFYIGRCMYVKYVHMTLCTQTSISDNRCSVTSQIENIVSIALVVRLETFR